jgi:hypothetical protein
MVGADKKTIAGVVVGLAAGGVYVTGPLAFPGVSIEVWQGFFWLMVVILATSGLYFALVHMIREERAMPISLMVVGSILFFAGAIWLGITNERETEPKPAQSENVPNVPEKPPTLHDVYKADMGRFAGFATTIAMTLASPTTSLDVNVEAAVHFDFDARSKFLSFYISRDQPTFDICAAIGSGGFQKILDGPLSVVSMISALPGDTSKTASEELVFSRRIFIYYDGDLTIQQQAAIDDLYKNNDLSVQLRGHSYWITRWNDPSLRTKH